MILSIFFIGLLILQILRLIACVHTNDPKNWKQLHLTLGLSFFCAALSCVHSRLNTSSLGWYAFVYWGIGICAALLFLIVLILAIILRFTSRNHPVLTAPPSQKQLPSLFESRLFFAAVVMGVFLIALFLQDRPHHEERKRKLLAQTQAKEYVLDYLERKYGDGNYAVLSLEDDGTRVFLFDETDGFTVTLRSDYCEKPFEVHLLKESFEVYEDTLVAEYYREYLGADDLEAALTDYAADKMNEELAGGFDVRIHFEFAELSVPQDAVYGHIPDPDELCEYLTLYNPRLDIEAELSTADELRQYLEELTRFFIVELDTSRIDYRYENKYFRYTYDYAKLGVKDYTDQYDGYGGYVYAGRYQYSEELGYYELLEEDTLVRINVLGYVSSYELEELISPPE